MTGIKSALERDFGITRLGSTNCGFVKLEHRIMTKWVPYNQASITRVMSGSSSYPFLEDVARVIEDLDHCQFAWRYSCWTATEYADDKSGKFHPVFCHMVDFQEKGEALMFKLRMR